MRAAVAVFVSVAADSAAALLRAANSSPFAVHIARARSRTIYYYSSGVTLCTSVIKSDIELFTLAYWHMNGAYIEMCAPDSMGFVFGALFCRHRQTVHCLGVDDVCVGTFFRVFDCDCCHFLWFSFFPPFFFVFFTILLMFFCLSPHFAFFFAHVRCRYVLFQMFLFVSIRLASCNFFLPFYRISFSSSSLASSLFSFSPFLLTFFSFRPLRFPRLPRLPCLRRQPVVCRKFLRLSPFSLSLDHPPFATIPLCAHFNL